MIGSNPQIMERKKMLRKLIEAERTMISEEARFEKSTILCQRAIEQIRLLRKASNSKHFILFTYIPFRAEINVLPIAEWCWQQGIQVAAPRVIQTHGELQFHYVSGYEDLYPQEPWGIREPISDAPKVESVLLREGCMLIPGIAFDPQKARLGYGGGYYDKYIQQLKQIDAANTPFKLALAYDLQIVPEVPSESHDFCVDMILTETRSFC
jgi:5-formyltetrahydrofolate cyclo-ligase